MEMSNLYDLEKFLEQRRREIDKAGSDADTLRLLRAEDSVRIDATVPALRARVGLMLIRLGSRLAA